MGENISSHISDQALISEYVENSKLNNKKMSNPINKWAKDQTRHSSRDIQMACKYVNRRLTFLVIQGNANQNHSEIQLHTHWDG